MTTLHAGGKFDNDVATRCPGGLHGVGVSCVNALSETCAVEVAARRQALHAATTCAACRPAAMKSRSPPRSRRRAAAPPVTFKPDTQIFETTDFHWDTIAVALRELAYLNSGLTIHLKDDAHRQDGRLLRQGRHRRVREVPQPRTRRRCTPSRSCSRASATTSSVEVAFQYNDTLCRDAAVVREQHQHDRGRHARERLPLGAHAHARQLRRTRKASTKKPQGRHRRRGRARGPDRGHLDQDAEPAVRGPDQDQARQQRDQGRGRDRGGRGAARVLRGEPAGRAQDRREDDRRRARPRGGAQGARAGAAQDASSTAARCPASSPTARSDDPEDVRDLHRRGRLGRRHREAGPRPALPGDPAHPRQDPERREGAHRQDPRQRGDPQHHHRAAAPG